MVFHSKSKKGVGINKDILTAVIHKEDNLYVALYPEVGTASQGETIEVALANLKEATELYLDEFNNLV
jgi:predicted RNase H-like HicB family nuclease